MTRIGRVSRARWTWLAVAMGCSIATPRVYAADAAAVEFHVAGGQLDKVLLQIAKQWHLVLSFNAALTRGLSAPSIEGTMTPKEALSNALAGSHLELIEVAGGTLTLRRAEKADEPSAATSPDHVLPKIDVVAS